MFEDQRAAPRLPLDVEVNFMERGMARSKDVSEGGICVIAEDEIPQGKIYNLSFVIPSTGERFTAFAKVVWNRKAGDHLYENGLEFWHMDDEAKDILHDYLKG
jgi:hypothetical protein